MLNIIAVVSSIFGQGVYLYRTEPATIVLLGLGVSVLFVIKLKKNGRK